MAKVKRISTMTIYKEDSYTLETVPETIDYNQFYCYSTYSGKIYIGTILGKSALKPYYKYIINERPFEVYEKEAFSEEKTSIDIRDTNFRCFLNYKDFVDAYNEYLMAIEAKKTVRKKKATRYMVQTETFQCKTTTMEKPYYRNKLFDTKEEAVEYATKGLKRLIKKTEKYSKTLNELYDVLSKSLKNGYAYLNCYGVSLDKYLEEMMAKPSNLKEGDTLAKIDFSYHKNFTTRKIDKDYLTQVKNFVNPSTILLSDNTLLYESECKSYSVPLLIKAEAVNKVTLLLKKASTRKVIEYIDREINALEKVHEYAGKYVPYKKGCQYSPVYFSEGYVTSLIKDVEDFIKDNNLKNG
jgi:hypothetical protein